MIKIISVLIVVCVGFGLSWAQDVTYAEYFIDINPGLGEGEQITIPEVGEDIALSFSVNTTGLARGFHTLYVRGQDSNGAWSLLHADAFYIFKEVITPPKVANSYLEYFIDKDPGNGLATSVNITSPDTNNTVSFIPDISSLSSGFHTLYVRTYDQNKSWSLYNPYAFYIPYEVKEETSEIVNVQYYFGSVNYLSDHFETPEFSPDTSITTEFAPDLTELMQDSLYAIRIFAIDSKGRRSLDYVHEFTFMPDLAFSVYNLDFDSVGVGDSSSFSIPVFAYEDSIDITGILMSNGNDYSVSIATLPTKLNRGDSVIINLKFKPQTTGTLKDTVLIINSSDNNPVKLFVSGQGINPTSIEDGEDFVPKTLVLRQNYPNPFNPITTIKYDLPKAMNVKVTVFNMLGQHINTLQNSLQQAGIYSIKWNGTNSKGNTVPSGVYMYKIKAGKTDKVFKMILLK